MEAQERLCRRTQQIVAAADGKQKIRERVQARKEKAATLWKSDRKKKPAAFQEIEETLRTMAADGGRCMYCEFFEGSTIDHFWPKAKYPTRTYEWANHVLSCWDCNHSKGDRFPRNARGVAMLLNPTLGDEPRDHLFLSPKTGLFIPLTCRGRHSIRVLRLNKRVVLRKDRINAYETAQTLIIAYVAALAQGNTELANSCKGDLLQTPLSIGLRYLLHVFSKPAARILLRFQCIEAIQRCPEIIGWLDEAVDE